MTFSISKKIALVSLVGAALTFISTQATAQDASAGESIWGASCAQCHGRSGRGSGSFPSVTGQTAEYISSKLMQYRAGEQIGPNSGLMIPAARNLTDDEISALALFISDTFQ